MRIEQGPAVGAILQPSWQRTLHVRNNNAARTMRSSRDTDRASYRARCSAEPSGILREEYLTGFAVELG